MTDYTAQYYILTRPSGDSVPYLAPDDDTIDRALSREKQPLGSPPFVFSNSWKERNRKEGVKEVVTPVLFHGSDIVVKSSIREALLELQLPNINIHPAIYIDDRDTWHEDYWYVKFENRFDCWDRELSDTSENFVETNGQRRYDVYEFVLDEDLLDRTPLQQRLLFKMGGTIDASMFCHESIVKVFQRDRPNGVKIVAATDF